MPLALSRTGVVFKTCYINDAGDFNRLARDVYKVLLTRVLPLARCAACPGFLARGGVRRGRWGRREC
jgi:hypothetical protein